ncbi:MAG: oligosaccharide flippase family protein [Candidatus Thiodiazotropha sp.]
MIKTALYVLILKIIGTALWLVYSILLARILTQDDFGLFFYIINFVLLVIPITNFGYGNILLKDGSVCFKEKKWFEFKNIIFEARTVTVLGSFIIAVLLLVSWSYDLNNPIVKDLNVSLLSGVIIILFSLMTIHRDTLRASNKVIKGMLNTTITRAFIPLVVIIIISISYEVDLEIALLVFCVSLLLSVLIEAYWIKNITNKNSSKSYAVSKNRKSLGMQLWFADIANTVLSKADAFIIGLVLDLKSVALYIAAQRISILTLFIIDAVRIVIGPEISKAFEMKCSPDYRKVISRSAALFSLAGIIGGLGSIVLGYPILLLYGEVYTDSYLILIILTLSNMSFIIFGPTAVIMSMTDLQKQRALVTTISASLLIVFSYFGAVLFNVTGVAIAVVIAMWTNNGLLSYMIWKNQKVESGIFNREALSYYSQKNIVSLLDAYKNTLKRK